MRRILPSLCLLLSVLTVPLSTGCAQLDRPHMASMQSDQEARHGPSGLLRLSEPRPWPMDDKGRPIGMTDDIATKRDLREGGPKRISEPNSGR